MRPEVQDTALVPLEVPQQSGDFTFFSSSTEPVKMLFFGDVMLDRNVKKRLDAHDPDYLFGAIKEEGLLDGWDLLHANLEGPFADKRRPTTKSIAFRFDPTLIPMLQKYGFSLFTLANNHTLDMGRDGFAESKKNLTAAGMEFYGAEYEINNDSLLIKEVKDLKIAFIGINDTHGPASTTLIAPLLEKAAIGADVTIVNIHWGEEYKPLSGDRQRTLAHWLIDNGADAVVGHHPHVVQEIEVYEDKPIFYSLGNFIFDQYFSVPTQEGLVVGLNIVKNESVEVRLFFLKSEESRQHLLSPDAASTTFKGLIERSRLGEYQMSSSTFTMTIPLE